MRTFSVTVIGTSLVLSLAPSRAVAQTDRSDYVSDASHVIGTYAPEAPEHSPEAMAAAAKRFLAALDDDLRARALHALDGPERRAWTNVPASPDDGGVRFGDLDAAQVRAACDLMATLFSRPGYDKLRDIMLADDQLLRGGRARPGFGTENFAVVVFGTPSPTDPWAFQLDGHHVGVNVAVRGAELTMSPSFIGTQPDAFRIGEREIRPLAGELDLAYALVDGLTDEQRASAIVGDRRRQIRTGPGTDGRVPERRGVSCATFDADQRAQLLALVAQWVESLPPEHAARRMKAIAGEIDEMRFAWDGATTPGSDISFSIQGPTVIIEYAGQDLGGDPLDHLHTMYRDPTNEYGQRFDAR